MNISEYFALIDRGATPKSRKATDFFINDNITRLFGTSEFEQGEARVAYTPKGLVITDNIFGDEVTSSIIIEAHTNGLVCKSQTTGELLFGIKRDDHNVVDIFHDKIGNRSYTFACGEDQFGYVSKDTEKGEVLYDGSLSIVGVRGKSSETFYLQVSTPVQGKNSLFKKKSTNGFIQLPITQYETVDEYDYLDSIFGVLQDNEKALLAKNNSELTAK